MRNFTILRFFQLRRFLLALSAISISALLSLANDQGDWPNWRGPNGNGSVDTGKYPVKWDPDNVLWKVPLPGKGTSTPIVWNDRIYLTSPSEGEDAVLAFDFSGKLLWQTKLGPEMRHKHPSLASSSNASPVTDGKRLFVYFKSGNFAALEFDGSVRWQINLVERFGMDQLFWDQGTSPVVTEKHVVMARMHGGPSWIAGFDKETGEMHWQQPRNYKTPPENDNGYTTPVVYEREGRESLLVWGADHLTAHDAADGKLLWFSGNFNPGNSGYWPAIATPVIVGNMAVVPVGRDDRPGQAHVHGIKMGGSGDVTGAHRAWKREDIGVFACSPAEYQGRVYLLRHRGELVCIDPASGKTIWSEAFPRTRASYYASPTIANGLLYAAREDGTVFVARVGDKFELISEIPMGEQIIATPVAVRNRLLIRGSENLFCVAGD